MDVERYSNPPEWDVSPCLCGCGEPAKEGSKYATSRCRTRAWELAHPRLDLSGMSIEQLKRAERMVQEAIRAAKEGLVRATVDARAPVKHEKDERPSCRVRLDERTWDSLGEMARRYGLSSRSIVVCELVREKLEDEATIDRFFAEELEAAS